MAFPIVQSVTQYRNGSGFSSGGTNHNWTLPATINAGDLLIAYFTPRYFLSTPPSGWVELHNTDYHYQYAYYRIADGTEGGATITWIISTSGNSSGNLYRITNYLGTPESATSTNDNPPSLTPSWGAADTLWIAEVNNVVANRYGITAPTGYTNLQANWVNVSFSTDQHISTAQRELNIATEDPGTFTYNTFNGNKSSTVAILGTPPSTDADLFEAEFLSFITYRQMKSLGYIIVSEQSATKSLEYAIDPSRLLTRDLEYYVEDVVAIQKSTQYSIVSGTSLTRGVTYVIETSSAPTKATTYAIQTQDVVTRDLGYEIELFGVNTLDTKYAIITTSSVTKGLGYYVIEEAALNKELEYSVKAEGALQRGVIYSVITTIPVTRDSDYYILTTGSETRGSEYQVISSSEETRTLNYEIVSDISIPVATKYTVLTTSVTQRNLEFRVSPSYSEERTLQYSLNYSPTRPQDLPKGSVIVRRMVGSSHRIGYGAGSATQQRYSGSVKHVRGEGVVRGRV